MPSRRRAWRRPPAIGCAPPTIAGCSFAPVRSRPRPAIRRWASLCRERERMMGYGNFATTISTLEAAISSVDYLVGNRFSAADLYVGAQIGFGMMFGTLE